MNGHFEVVKYLVHQGADINCDDDRALIYSAVNGHLEVVKFLVKNGAYIHADDDLALRWSARYGQRQTVEYLMLFYTIDKLNSLNITRVNEILKTWNYAAKVIQLGCHNWLYSPITRDLKVGIVPRLEWQKIQELI
jgi:ankyrin repeat protein